MLASIDEEGGEAEGATVSSKKTLSSASSNDRRGQVCDTQHCFCISPSLQSSMQDKSNLADRELKTLLQATSASLSLHSGSDEDESSARAASAISRVSFLFY